jgi:rhodanese-related sulfurtransferase
MRTLAPDELKQMLSEGEDFHPIDVLGRDAFREAHIPGSRNLPLADTEFPSKVEELIAGTDEKIVVYCASFDCTASPKAAKALDQAGFTRGWDYEGGIKDWSAAGYPLEHGRETDHS